MHHLLWLFLLLWTAQEEPSISKAEYKERRQKLVQGLCENGSSDLVVLRAQKLTEGEAGIDQNTARFDFLYLAGTYRAGTVLVLHEETAILFTDEVEEAKKSSAVDDVLPLEKYEAFLKETLPATKRVYDWRHPWAKEDKLASQKFKDINPDLQVRTSVHEGVTKLRLIKSEAELRCMRRASDATNQAHIDAMKRCQPGMNEGELQKIIEDAFRKGGCPKNAFPCIVGSGKNGTILHYMENKDAMKAETLVVMDIGAEYRAYATDITRTIPVDGKFTAEHRKAYQAVLDSQKAAEAVLKPGATWGDLDRAAAKVLRDRGYPNTAYMKFHGLGHFVGLAVHDSGFYREAFEPGMVITIEPGIYDKKAAYGIRIEDIYLVTKDGFERLSAGAPREIEEIERVMAGE